ncbi:MAG: hypothetical protein R3A12_17270 [Ignavibacteria bacterium]
MAQSIDMVDANTGYFGGGFFFPTVFKTTNGGTNWNSLLLFPEHSYIIK